MNNKKYLETLFGIISEHFLRHVLKIYYYKKKKGYMKLLIKNRTIIYMTVPIKVTTSSKIQDKLKVTKINYFCFNTNPGYVSLSTSD